jgi:hypothetical protein
MAEDDLRTLIEEALLDLDPELNISAGSPAQIKVVDRIMTYVGEDPFDTDISTFISTRLAQEYPHLSEENAAAITDLLVGPYRTLYEPITREINVMKQRQSIRDINIHTEDSLEAILSNIFMEREEGDYARGTVRTFYSSPQYVAATSDVRFFDGGGHNFFPNGDQFISQKTMLFNKIGDEYYFDVMLVASEQGEDYEVAPDKIKYVEGIPGVKRVTNRFKFQGGSDRETNELFLTRAQNYPTEAALNARRGILYVIQENFPNVDQIEVVGYGDADMQRDKLTGMGYGPIAASALGGGLSFPVEDGDYDGLTDLIRTATINYPAVIGVSGPISNRATLVVAYQDSLANWYVVEHEIIEVLDVDLVRIDTKLDISQVNGVLLRFHSVCISDIPGGFAFPDQNEVPDGVHIGGAIDIYIKDKSPAEESVDMGIASDETYVVITEDAEIVAGQRAVILKDVDDIRTTVHENTVDGAYSDGVSNWFILKDIAAGSPPFYRIPQDLEPGDIIYVPTLNEYYTITSLDSSAYATPGQGLKAVVNGIPAGGGPLAGRPYVIYKYSGAIKKGMVVQLTSGEPGTYRIFRGVGWSDVATHLEAGIYLLTSYEFTVSSTGVGARVYDDVEINLTEPKTIKEVDTDLSTIIGSTTVTSTSGHDFLALGVVKDDILRILEGPNAGDYTVEAVAGAGWSSLIVDSGMGFTVGSQSYQVFTLNDALDTPLLNVTSMELLNASLQPEGIEIPIGQPLAAITGDFTNMSRGIRYDPEDVVVGCFGRDQGTAVPAYTLAGKLLNLKFTYPNPADLFGYADVTTTIEFAFGAGPFNDAQDVVDEINTNLSGLGIQFAVDIRGHVALRTTGDVLIEVLANSVGPGSDAAAEIGWVEDKTKSNGIVVPTDPRLAGVNSASDYCYIQAGPNGGGLHKIDSFDSYGTDFVVYLDPRSTFLKPNNEDDVLLGFLSTGNIRFYFRDPTYFEVNQNTVFTVTDTNGVSKSYIPDPTLGTLVFPYGDETKAVIASIVIAPDKLIQIVDYDGLNELTETRRDDDDAGLTISGDIADVTFRRLWFDIDLGAGPLAWTSPALMRMAVGDSVYKDIDLDNLPAGATIDELIDEINGQFPEVASSIDIAGRRYLVLDSEHEIKINANGNFLAAIGDPLSDATRTTNRCDSYGTYRVLTMQGDDTIWIEELTGILTVELDVVDPAFPAATEDPLAQITLSRPGMQRLCTTAMNDQIESGYYYADMEFVSWGVGDQFNVGPDLYGDLTGYKCWGYTLKNTNEALAFSTEEEIYTVITSQILELDVDCSPVYERLIAGKNVRVNYLRSPTTEDVHTFITADTERVVNASVVAKHLLPTYLTGIINYTGQMEETKALTNITDMVEGLSPDDRLEISDVSALLTNLGASYIQTPVVLAAFVQNMDRTMYVRFIEDTSDLGDLSTYFVDVIALNRLS